MSAPAIDTLKLSACIHCGLCLDACPTYLETGEEMTGPRGRLYLMRNYVEGKLEVTDPAFAEHEGTCLVCRACETACPSGVEFGVLMEQTRAILPKKHSAFSRFIYERLLPSRTLLKLGHTLTAIVSKLGLARVARKTFPSGSKFGAALSLLPQKVDFPASRRNLYRSSNPNGKRIGLLLGCVGDVFTQNVNTATIKVLNALGYDVDTMPDVTCCGALAAHAGYVDVTKKLAVENLKTFASTRIDHVISNIAGCGAMLKEYQTLIGSTNAAVAKGKIFDINEFLFRFHRDDLKFTDRFAGRRIAYQAPCHLTHGQRVVDEPLALLKLLPGAIAFGLEENLICCGSAGSYNIEHPEMAEALRKRKMQLIVDAAPDIVATANAGCLLQLSKENSIPVRHVIELIAEALQGA